MRLAKQTMVLAGLALATAAVTPDTGWAQQRGRGAEPALQVSYPTDGGLSCDQLVVEIGRMEEIAGLSAQNADSARTQGAVVDAAASVAVNAALYSGALGAVPGLGLFANAAGAMARRSGEARARAEAERVQTATQRRTLLSGIYQGRQCGVQPAAPPAAPLVEADQEPPVEAPPAPQPAVEGATAPA